MSLSEARQRELLSVCQKHLVDLNDMKGEGVTNYGYVGKKGNFHDYMGQPCLGGLFSSLHEQNGPLQAFYLWNDNKPDDEDTNRYIDHLISPEKSPYRSMMKSQVKQDPDFIHKYGYVLTNLDYPGNLVFNFLTAWRYPYENRQYLAPVWHRLFKDGVSFGTCAAVMDGVSLTDLTKKDRFLLYSGGKGHYAFNAFGGSGLELSDRVNEGNPDHVNFTKHYFSKNPFCLPVNVIWGSGKNNSAFKRYEKWYHTARIKQKEGTRLRIFKDPDANQTYKMILSYEELLEFARAIDRKEV